MTAVNKAWPAVAPSRPSTGSWDDLLLRGRRKDSKGENVYSKNDMAMSKGSSRPPSAASGYTEHAPLRGRGVERPSSSSGDTVTGRTHSNSPVRTPANPRSMTHHQRDSSGFARHMAAMNGNPSPLRTVRTLRSSDSMPELNLGGSSKNNNYTTERPEPPPRSSQRPSMHTKPSRLAESISISDLEPPQITPDILNCNTMPKTEGRMRASSWHGKHPTKERIPSESYPPPKASLSKVENVSQRRPERIKKTRPRKAGPNEIFDKLPREVLNVIIGHLRNSHLHRSSSCATCWMRDCCSIALSNSKLLKASRDVLYEDIQLIGQDCPQQRKKYKGVYSTRLVLLRRTLRENPKLAATVRYLKVPALPDDAPLETRAYHDIVASVIMACPKLERLDGFYPTYNHSESRLFNALATRTKLKEMTWVVDGLGPEPEVIRGHRFKSSKSKDRHSRRRSSVSTLSSQATRYLPASLANKFVRHHMQWLELTHLTIHCLPGAQLNTPNSLLNVIQTYLTSLQSLHLSHVPSSAFNDMHLVTLPIPLKKLTLSHCPGVTATGLSTFATGTSAQRLETLTLMHQNLDTLPAVVRLLAKLSKLTTFSLVQAAAPTMPDDEPVWLMPYLGSRSLRFLHWDVFDSAWKDRNGDMPGTKTDDILARSIAANGFPKLRFLRVPCDPDGKFQALCRPKERVDLPGDRYRNGGPTKSASTGALRSLARNPELSNANLNTTIIKPYAATGTLGPYSSSALSLLLPPVSELGASSDNGRPSSSLSTYSTAANNKRSSMFPARETGSDLHKARLVAQARLEAARGFPLFEANIVDEDGSVMESSGLAGFLGDIKSSIIYTLAPDAGGSDERGGLVGVVDLLDDGGEDLTRQGDTAWRSGAGFGTGCVASEWARSPAGMENEAAAGLADKVKVKSAKGKIVKSKPGKDGAENKDGGGLDGKRKGSREGCSGRWNAFNEENFTMDPKVGDRWAHVERGRWRGRLKLS